MTYPDLDREREVWRDFRQAQGHAMARRWRENPDVIVPKSQHIRETVAYAYGKGGSSLLDLLVAERNDNDVRLGQAQAASDLAVATASLKAATTTVEESEH